MENIFVLGTGTMGAIIAQTFATKGYEVILKDITDELVDKSLDGINKSISKLVEGGKITEEVKEDLLSRISGTTDINLAEDSDLVVEATVENIKMNFLNSDPVTKLVDIIKEIATSEETFKSVKAVSVTTGNDQAEVSVIIINN